MHYKSREAVHRAIQSGVLTFQTVEGDQITCRRAEIGALTYVDDGLNEHGAVVSGRKRRVSYKEFAKLKAFFTGTDPSKSWDPWVAETAQKARR